MPGRSLFGATYSIPSAVGVGIGYEPLNREALAWLVV
jgi:hypothetical protein